VDEHTLWPLHLVPAEDVVFLPAWALGASQTANQENRNTGGNYEGQKASARHEPLNETMHRSPEHEPYQH
jgi:hypothetical protein